jgi:ribosomal protein S18 acetylase RimI-like enzyme
MPKVQIRPTVATDLTVLMAFDHSCQSEYVWQMDVLFEETQTTAIFREVRLPRAVSIPYPRSVAMLSETWSRRAGMLTALVDETIVGYVRMNDTIVLHTAWLTDVVVSPRYRRQGIASTLILAAQTWAVNRHNNRVLLEMTSKNVPAIHLAQKLGFEFSGYNDAYYETQDIALFFGRSIA